MRRTLQEQIALNRRSSLFWMIGLVLLLTALGTAVWGTYDPHEWYLGTVGSLILSVVLALVARFQGPGIVLSISRAREATHDEYQMLDNVVEEMAIAGGMPKPRIFVIDDLSPNAFATGVDPEHGIITVTSGLLAKLDRDELQGVIAHEMSHIRNYDIRFMTTVALIAGFIPLLADFFLRMQFWTGGDRGRDRDSNGNDLGGLFQIVGIVLAIVVPLFAWMMELAISRQREFLADASAAELTRLPDGLARALQKIATDPLPLLEANRATAPMYIVNPLRRRRVRSDLFSTHPSTEERIERLHGLMGHI